MVPFAVIDTETNWYDQVMSIGVVLADPISFAVLESRYYILPEPCQVGGMFSHALYTDTPEAPIHCPASQVERILTQWLGSRGVRDIFAYNAGFDRRHLPGLRSFVWHDIMAMAAYRQYNPRIPATWECCSTGRLKRGYGVENMLRLLSGDAGYRESHNAYLDAWDELRIMALLGYRPDTYPVLP